MAVHIPLAEPDIPLPEGWTQMSFDLRRALQLTPLGANHGDPICPTSVIGHSLVEVWDSFVAPSMTRPSADDQIRLNLDEALRTPENVFPGLFRAVLPEWTLSQVDFRMKVKATARVGSHSWIIGDILALALALCLNGRVNPIPCPTVGRICLLLIGRNFTFQYVSSGSEAVAAVHQRLWELGLCTEHAILIIQGCELSGSTPISSIGIGSHCVSVWDPPRPVESTCDGFGKCTIVALLRVSPIGPLVEHEGNIGVWFDDLFWYPKILCRNWCWIAYASSESCQIWHAGQPSHSEHLAEEIRHLGFRRSLEFACDIQEQPGQCGPCLPVVLAIAQGNHPSISEVRASVQLATSFCAQYAAGHPPEPQLGGGLPAKATKELQSILTLKGVPEHAISDRIQGLLQIASNAQVEAALKQTTAKQRWSMLCEAAGSTFRLVTSDEIKMQKRAKNEAPKPNTAIDPLQHNDPWLRPHQNHQHGIDSSGPKGLEIDNLQCQSDVFVTEQGTRLDFLTLPQVVSDATGVCVATLKQASPFMQGSKNLSAYPLALFVLEAEGQVVTGFPKATCSLPAKLKDSGGSIVLLGTLVQIGDAKVVRFTSPNACQVMPPASRAFRIVVHRVHYTSQEWNGFTAHPVRSAIAGIPTLSTQHKMLLDYWGHRTTSSQITFKIRVNDQVGDQVRKDSGCNLIFVDDIPDENNPRQGWVVVWLPDHSHDQAKAKAQMHPVQCGIVVKNPGKAQIFGLRVLAKDAVELRLQIVPEATQGDGYVPIVRHFILQPVPAGCDQDTISQILASVKWTARPLKPVGRHAYRVGAAEAPACDRIQHITGDILIQEVPKPGEKRRFDTGRQPVVIQTGPGVAQPSANPSQAAVPRICDVEQRVTDKLAVVEQRFEAKLEALTGKVADSAQSHKQDIDALRHETSQHRQELINISSGNADISKHLLKLTSAFEAQSKQLQDLIQASSSEQAHKVRVKSQSET